MLCGKDLCRGHGTEWTILAVISKRGFRIWRVPRPALHNKGAHLSDTYLWCMQEHLIQLCQVVKWCWSVCRTIAVFSSKEELSSWEVVFLSPHVSKNSSTEQIYIMDAPVMLDLHSSQQHVFDNVALNEARAVRARHFCNMFSTLM